MTRLYESNIKLECRDMYGNILKVGGLARDRNFKEFNKIVKMTLQEINNPVYNCVWWVEFDVGYSLHNINIEAKVDTSPKNKKGGWS